MSEDKKKKEVKLQGKRETKTEPQQATKARFKVDENGSVVVLPPEEEDGQVQVLAAVEAYVEANKGGVTVKVDGEDDPSQVTDAESEALSSESSKSVQEENAERAKEASVDLSPRKAGNSVVSEGTFNDINLPEYEKQTKKAEAQVEEDGYGEAKQDAEADFRKELERVLAEQSDDSEEDFQEVYEESEDEEDS